MRYLSYNSSPTPDLSVNGSEVSTRPLESHMIIACCGMDDCSDVISPRTTVYPGGELLAALSVKEPECAPAVVYDV